MKKIKNMLTCKSINIQKHVSEIANKKKCRFGAPWPPLDKTQILYPLEPDEVHDKELHSKTYDDINKFIQTKYKNKNFIDFYQILNQLNISYKTYILALRSTIKKKTIFLNMNSQRNIH